MQIKYFLSALFADVEQKFVAVDPLLCSELLRLENQKTRNMRRLRRDVSNRRHKLLWYKEKMRRCLGMNVTEDEHFVVLVFDRRRNLLADDFVEDGVGGRRHIAVGCRNHRRQGKGMEGVESKEGIESDLQYVPHLPNLPHLLNRLFRQNKL